MSGISVALAILLQTSAAPTPAAASTGNDGLICRRIEVTGYVARREKVCKTKLEWRNADENGNSRARAIVDFSTGRPTGQ
ncbi:hypothetical protein SPMU_26220 [Sphingomonas mucosissima]|uniref:Uncharacterized protein n=2 Tax=Sphingomonas mucosissima TaxID=370959 RepID=A0A245ZH61_9SPHN|nr:hypothetical protein SPMU_26220 [Sphingomonas mucosissima]